MVDVTTATLKIFVVENDSLGEALVAPEVNKGCVSTTCKGLLQNRTNEQTAQEK